MKDMFVNFFYLFTYAYIRKCYIICSYVFYVAINSTKCVKI